MSSQSGLVQRLWNYCNVLRDDGLSYGDYLEQLTYLLFLKMADEQTKAPFSAEPFIPEGLDWPSLLARDGDELEVHYRHVLTELGRRSGMLGVVFRKAQNRIQDPAKLRRHVHTRLRCTTSQCAARSSRICGRRSQPSRHTCRSRSGKSQARPRRDSQNPPSKQRRGRPQ
jgi:hypothetical protein